MTDLGGDTRLISTAKAADYLGVPVRKLRDNYRAWGIPAVRLGPRTLQFRVNALERFIAERAV